jgi:hypothetical protein
MTQKFLDYRLVDGYIHNWLVAGPSALVINNSEIASAEGSDLDRKEKIVSANYNPDGGVSQTPVDLAAAELNGAMVQWNYYRCHLDHLVNIPTDYPTWQYVRTWVHTQIIAVTPGKATFVLCASSAVTVWVNGNLVFRSGKISQETQRYSFETELGVQNEILVRMENVSVRADRDLMALRMVATTAPEGIDGMAVKIATTAKYPPRLIKQEIEFEKAYLEQVVNYRGAHFNLCWADDVEKDMHYAYQIQDAEERIYVEGTWETGPKEGLDVGHGFRLYERPYKVVLQAPGREYYEMNMRYKRALPIHILDTSYASTPSGNYPERRAQALKEATKYETNLFAEMAKMELGHWSDINLKLFESTADRVKRGEAGSETLLVGLLGMLYRYGKNEGFPQSLQPLIADCAMQFTYQSFSSVDTTSESSQILLFTSEILAGQRYENETFERVGLTGEAIRKSGEQQALEWLRTRGSRGFSEWDSNESYEKVLLALSQIVSHVELVSVSELAAVLLDKVLFTLALNTHQGAFGATHGKSSALMLKSAQLEATSGICRMLYGMGVFNHHILATVGLACSDYEFPSFFAELAANSPEEMWSMQRQGPDAGNEVNQVMYKTPDYLLSSAQAYRAGEKGKAEHIWQATMGPDAVVFVNHPACVEETEADRPGFWSGNAVLPKVAQWKNTLIAIYNLPEDDRMGFTHAYFPVHAFDEYIFEGNWAFARKGSAYLAITSGQGFELIKRGPDGFHELRSYGKESIWVCMMGREAVEKDFRAFQKKVLKTRMDWKNLATSFKSIYGEDLSLGWNEPFRVNGEERPLKDYKHFENLFSQAEFGASEMEIHYNGIGLKLNFD